jgi:anti-anti-sigma factor
MTVSVHSAVPDPVVAGLRILVGHQGTTTTIALEGEWDLAEREATRRAVHSALARRPEQVVLDLSRLTFIDSSGVHGTMELARRSAARNIRLAIIPGPRAVQRVFELCHLAELLPFLSKG